MRFIKEKVTFYTLLNLIYENKNMFKRRDTMSKIIKNYWKIPF